MDEAGGPGAEAQSEPTRLHGVFTPNSKHRGRVTPGKRDRRGCLARTADPGEGTAWTLNGQSAAQDERLQLGVNLTLERLALTRAARATLGLCARRSSTCSLACCCPQGTAGHRLVERQEWTAKGSGRLDLPYTHI